MFSKNHIIKKVFIVSLLIIVVMSFNSCSLFKSKKSKRSSSATSSQEYSSKSNKNWDRLDSNLVGTDTVTEEIRVGANSKNNSSNLSDDSLFSDEGPIIDDNSGSVNRKALKEKRSPAATMTGEASGMSGEIGEYTVGKGETLMWVAFKIYGNYNKWKSIAKLNSKKVRRGEIIKEGTVLKYKKPKNEFVWEPKGEPYLVKMGDTLGKISKKVYDTIKRWKEIWKNNKEMIKNPNIIFSGFTLYYVPSENGKLASSPKAKIKSKTKSKYKANDGAEDTMSSDSSSSGNNDSGGSGSDSNNNNINIDNAEGGDK
ncbi:MAG: LysM peptidoglycan-binding domain-containing protein [Oligoflexia bacterium]|nr:LysM peptidoglycan-binding domain-containing protein [Oligoflexia bacterium]